MCLPCCHRSYTPPSTYASNFIVKAQRWSMGSEGFKKQLVIPLITGIGVIILGAAGAVGNGILVVTIVPLCLTGSAPLKRLASCVGMVFKGAGIFISGLGGHNVLIVYPPGFFLDDANDRDNGRKFRAQESHRHRLFPRVPTDDQSSPRLLGSSSVDDDNDTTAGDSSMPSMPASHRVAATKHTRGEGPSSHTRVDDESPEAHNPSHE